MLEDGVAHVDGEELGKYHILLRAVPDILGFQSWKIIVTYTENILQVSFESSVNSCRIGIVKVMVTLTEGDWEESQGTTCGGKTAFL